jgi:hypothetical protein
MDVLVERLSQLEQEQEMEAREFQLVVLQVHQTCGFIGKLFSDMVLRIRIRVFLGSVSTSIEKQDPHQSESLEL